MLKDRIREILGQLVNYCEFASITDPDIQKRIDEKVIPDILTEIPKETCICAAVIAEDGKAYRGHRHGDCIVTILGRGKKCKGGFYSQGFITSRNRYVDRYEGFKLQKASNIPSAWQDDYRGEVLFSEDLY